MEDPGFLHDEAVAISAVYAEIKYSEALRGLTRVYGRLRMDGIPQADALDRAKQWVINTLDHRDPKGNRK